MPDKRLHRGPHPADADLFGEPAIARLRSAVADFSLLLTKGYADKSSLKLVGDRFSLTERQRLAVLRCACSDKQLQARSQNNMSIRELADKSIAIDGYNALITVEAALSNGLIFKARDGCYKDLASLHGTYRKVTETIPAINIIGQFLNEKDIRKVLWLLDSPVSNSGKLKTIIAEIAEQNKWDWQVELCQNPDVKLININTPVASSDGIILDKCKKWVNLAAEIIMQKIPAAKIIDLSDSSAKRWP